MFKIYVQIRILNKYLFYIELFCKEYFDVKMYTPIRIPDRNILRYMELILK